MSKRHFTYFQQFGGGAIENLDSAIAKLSGIIESLKQVNKGKIVTPTSIVVPPSTGAELSAQQSDLVNWDDKVGGNVLHHISSPQALELLLLSVPSLKDKINQTNDAGLTPLDIALTGNNFEIIKILENNGAITGKAVAYTRQTMIPSDVVDVYGESPEKVPSTGSIGSTGKSVGPVKIPSVGPLKSMSASASASTQRKASTPASSSGKESTKSNTSTLENIVKRSSMWMAFVRTFGPGALVCTPLQIFSDNESLSEIITNYYFRWNEKDNKLESPTKLDNMIKKCKERMKYGQVILFPLIVYKNNGNITYNFINYNYLRGEVCLVGILEKNPIVFPNFDKQINDILLPYLYLISIEDNRENMRILRVSGIDYNIINPTKNYFIKKYIIPISENLGEKYTNIYGTNLLYLLNLSNFSAGKINIAKFNNMLVTGFFDKDEDDEDDEDTSEIKSINIKYSLHDFIKKLKDLPPDISQYSEMAQARVAGAFHLWDNKLY